MISVFSKLEIQILVIVCIDIDLSFTKKHSQHTKGFQVIYTREKCVDCNIYKYVINTLNQHIFEKN